MKKKPEYHSSVWAKNDTYVIEAIESGNYRCDENGFVYSRYSRQGHVMPDNQFRKLECSTRNGYRFIKYKGRTLSVHRMVFYYFNRYLNQERQINHIRQRAE